MNPNPGNGSPYTPALTRGGDPARTKIKFELNVPITITLEFDPPPEPREGNWGPQYMYFLGNNRIGFFDPPLHEEILRKGARAGHALIVCKRKTGNAIKWEVNRPGEFTPEPAAPPPIVSKPRERTPTQLSGSDRITGNLMTAALRQAIEACEESGFAGSHEDVRALAITIYIAACGGKQK